MPIDSRSFPGTLKSLNELLGVSDLGGGSPLANIFAPARGFFESALKLMLALPNFEKNTALAFLKAA